MARLNTTSALRSTLINTPISLYVSPTTQLRRTMLACMLWEDGFYENGESVADRITYLVKDCEAQQVADLAVEARNKQHLRHVPLLLICCLAKKKNTGRLVSKTLYEVIQRPDELTEFLAIYWKDGRQPLSAQVKKGLAHAFTKFSAYQLAKYNRKAGIKLRDVLFMVHAKPRDKTQASIWKQLIDGTLSAPDTWEVGLSSGADKRETFERLIKEGKLGYMALLRNLRNMVSAGVSEKLVHDALKAGAKTSKALPFRYIAAARAVPEWKSMIEIAMMKALNGMPRMHGRTVLLIDVSDSMTSSLSAKSDLNRLDAACALAMLVHGICNKVRVFSFSAYVTEVSKCNGMALIDAIMNSQPNSCTYLGNAVHTLDSELTYDRLIVITDEQSQDRVPTPKGRGYMINVASYKCGVSYGDWIRIDGWSEAVVNYIQELETTVGFVTQESC